MTVRDHVKKYKQVYITASVCVVLAGITYTIMRSNSQKPLGICIARPAKDLHSKTMDHGVSISAGGNVIGNTINNIQYGGYSHKLVQHVSTGEIFKSVTAAAEVAGVEVSRMSRHINGHIPHINGEIYRIIGIGTN